MNSQLIECAARLEPRLLRGEHLTLFGPRGSGKSSVLAQLYARLQRRGVPCAYSPATAGLGDITRALERAYPGVDTAAVGRRAARVRLWYAADRRGGVLLLDHFVCSGSAMVSFLRRLHGRIAGVLSAVDVEAEEEQQRMRPWRYGALSVRMPLASSRQLRAMLERLWSSRGLPALEVKAAQAFVQAARGRAGWIVQCVELAGEPRYWRPFGPMVTVLCVDTEAAVRWQALAMVRADQPHRRARTGDAQHSAGDGRSAASGLITPKCAGR